MNKGLKSVSSLHSSYAEELVLNIRCAQGDATWQLIADAGRDAKV